MRPIALALAVALAIASAASAQVWIMSPAKQGGSSKPVPSVPCTNQLVLDYSNSCALIGQGWGE